MEPFPNRTHKDHPFTADAGHSRGTVYYLHTPLFSHSSHQARSACDFRWLLRTHDAHTRGNDGRGRSARETLLPSRSTTI